jgi:hypothetical protein
MPFSFAKVDEFVKTLPNVTVGAKWNTKNWIVNDRGFAWVRPLGKADIGRWPSGEPLPEGEILGVRVESLDAKDAFLAMGLPGFFTIEHFNNYAAILIELRKASAKDVKAALVHGHAAMAAAPPPKKRSKKPAKPRARKSAAKAR